MERIDSGSTLFCSYHYLIIHHRVTATLNCKPRDHPIGVGVAEFEAAGRNTTVSEKFSP
jgi:hypothetical protein